LARLSAFAGSLFCSVSPVEPGEAAEKSLKNRQNYAKMRETKEKDGRAHEQPGV
jgi:hypothetical protein